MCGVDPRLVFGRTVLLPHADLSLGPFNGRYNVFDLVWSFNGFLAAEALCNDERGFDSSVCAWKGGVVEKQYNMCMQRDM